MSRLGAEIVDKKQLTLKESEVLRLISAGLPDKAIARVLGIHVKTLSKHIDHVYEKLGIRCLAINTRCTAIGVAVSKGMVKLSIRQQSGGDD